MKNDQFENHIATLTRVALNRRNITTLLETLGCRVLRVKNGSWRIQATAQPTIAQEGVTNNALLVALRSSIAAETAMVGDTFGLLDGLSKKDRWRGCLLSIDDAYDFSRTLLNFSLQTGRDGYAGDNALESTIAQVMVPTLNAWLRPVVPFDTQPDMDTMVGAMFGDAWRHLIGQEQIANGEVILLVKAHRPPFLPGLVYAQVEYADTPLPPLAHP